MSIFQDVEGTSSIPADDTFPEARGDEPSPEGDTDSAGPDVNTKVAELERKLQEERSTNEHLLARMTTLETALGAISKASPQAVAEAEPATVSIEDLRQHAGKSPEAAFEAAVAFVNQTTENFRRKWLKEQDERDQTQTTAQAVRSELTALLPGVDVPGHPVQKAVLEEMRNIQARRLGIDPNRAYDLAIIAVAKKTGGTAGPLPPNPTKAGGAGAAVGGEREPGQAAKIEFTKSDEDQLRRMKPDSKVFSKDPKVRAQAINDFLRIKADIARRSRRRDE